MKLMQKTFRSVLSMLCMLAFFIGQDAQGELASLTDSELSEVDGAGVGLVFEDFVFSHGNDAANGQIFKISGLTSTTGEPVTVNVNQLYIARSGSNYGSVLNGVNLGRLTNPFNIDVVDGDTIGIAGKAVLEFAAPDKVAPTVGYDCLSTIAIEGSGTCSSRPANTTLPGGGTWINGERPDIGLEMEVNVGAKTPTNLNIHAKSAVFDGSYLRVWGDNTRNQMAAEFKLNFYSPELEISTCTANNQGCSSNIKMSNFEMELALGNQFQPMYVGVNSLGNMELEIKKITHQFLSSIAADGTQASSYATPEGTAAWDFFNSYYTDPSYRSNISVGDMNIGGTSFGSSQIQGMLIQYMKIEMHDLTP